MKQLQISSVINPRKRERDRALLRAEIQCAKQCSEHRAGVKTGSEQGTSSAALQSVKFVVESQILRSVIALINASKLPHC